MTLTGRDPLIDRPELVNRDDEEDNDENTESETVHVIGEGGGPVINGIEFRPGDFDIVAGANLTAVLSTGQDRGEAFEQSFRNAAIQLNDLKEVGEDITDLRRFSVDRGVADAGVSDSQFEVLNSSPEQVEQDDGPDGTEDQEENAENDSEVDEEETEEDTNIDEVEEDIEDIEDES